MAVHNMCSATPIFRTGTKKPSETISEQSLPMRKYNTGFKQPSFLTHCMAAFTVKRFAHVCAYGQTYIDRYTHAHVFRKSISVNQARAHSWPVGVRLV